MLPDPSRTPAKGRARGAGLVEVTIHTFCPGASVQLLSIKHCKTGEKRSDLLVLSRQKCWQSIMMAWWHILLPLFVVENPRERNKIEKGKIFKSDYMTLKFKTHFHNRGSDFFFKQTFLLGLHLHLQFHLLILTPKQVPALSELAPHCICVALWDTVWWRTWQL